MATPASIRYNNPGAQWDGKIAKKWGSSQHVVLADGQSNHIAIFPTKVQGAAAQFDLWRTSYANMTLDAAVKKWSGGNSSKAYMSFLNKNVGVNAGTLITPAFLAGEQGLKLMKAQAQWEAGQVYPMSDAEWAQAQQKVFGSSKVAQAPASASVIVAAPVAAGAAWYADKLHWFENHWVAVVVGAIGVAVAVDLVIALIRNGKNNVGQA